MKQAATAAALFVNRTGASGECRQGRVTQSLHVALALAGGSNNPPGHNFMHYFGLAGIMKRPASGIERLAHDLGGVVVKYTTRHEWNDGAHAKSHCWARP